MRQNLSLRSAFTVGALALAVLHSWKPDWKIDSITAVLLIAAVLPWFQPLIKSVELLGVKLELQEVKDELADQKGATASVERKTAYLLSGDSPAPSIGITNTRESDAPDETFEQLMREYEGIRSTQPRGPARTQAMTKVVRKMIELTPSLKGFDPEHALSSGKAGQRLAAYAYVYAKPDFHYVAPLVASVTALEDKPFGQYWGLQAISRVLASRDDIALPQSVRLQLRQYADTVPRGTDRDYEIRKILRDLGTGETSD